MARPKELTEIEMLQEKIDFYNIEIDCKQYEILHHERNINKFNFNLKYYYKILNVLNSELQELEEQKDFYSQWLYRVIKDNNNKVSLSDYLL